MCSLHILQLCVDTFYILLCIPIMAVKIAETCSSWYSSKYTLYRLIIWFFLVKAEFGMNRLQKINIWAVMPNDTTSHPTTMESLAAWLWEPQISCR